MLSHANESVRKSRNAIEIRMRYLLAHFALSTFAEILIESVKVLLQFSLRLDGRKNVTNNEEIQLVIALWTLELVTAIRQCRLT